MHSEYARSRAFAVAAALAASAALPASLFAAETIKLEEARRTALERNREVLRAELSVRQAEIAEGTAAAGLMPSVSAGASWSALLEDGSIIQGDPSVSLSASQTLFSGGAKTTALKNARVATEQARESLRAARISALEEIDARFLAAAEKRLAYEAAAKATGAAAKQLEIARGKREAGKLSEAELLQARSSWATKRTAETQAKWAAETALRSLSAYLGRDAEPADLDQGIYDALAAIIQGKAEADLDGFVRTLYERGMAADPSLRKLEAAVSAAALSVDAKRAAFFPTLSASASLGATIIDGSVVSASPTIRLSASLPIFPFTDRTGALVSARIGVESAESQVADKKEALLLSFYSTTLELLSASGQIASADAALAYAEANHELALEKFKLGAGASSVVADAESTLETARAQSISARFDLYAAVAGLARLIGAEDEKGLADALR